MIFPGLEMIYAHLKMIGTSPGNDLFDPWNDL
jgi:hypothetical protein